MARNVNPVCWFEIYVDDMDRAKKFYTSVLGEELEDMAVPDEEGEGAGFRMVSFPYVENAPNANGALVQASGVKAGGSGTLVYFTCDDCAVEESRVEAAGGAVIKSKFPIGEHGFCTICQDTEGNTFGLHSMG